jgi:hypothetical protein
MLQCKILLLLSQRATTPLIDQVPNPSIRTNDLPTTSGFGLKATFGWLFFVSDVNEKAVKS